MVRRPPGRPSDRTAEPPSRTFADPRSAGRLPRAALLLLGTVVVLMGLPAGVWSHTVGPLVTPPIRTSSGSLSGAPSVPAPSSNSTFCPGGNLSSHTNSSLSLTVCVVTDNAPSGSYVALWANASGGSRPYSFSFDFGDSSSPWTGTYGSNTTGNSSGLTGWVYRSYTSNGNYTVSAYLHDANWTWSALHQIVHIDLVPTPLAISAYWVGATINGVPEIQYYWSITGGSSPYDLAIDFGDGASYGGRNVPTSASSYVDHDYANATAGTQYTAQFTAFDSTGARAQTNVTVTPNGTSGGGGTGGGGNRSGATVTTYANDSAALVDEWSGNLSLVSNLSLYPFRTYALLVDTMILSAPSGRVFLNVSYGDAAGFSGTTLVNGTGSRLLNLTHDYSTVGAVTLNLTVSDAVGDSATAIVPLSVSFLPSSNRSGGYPASVSVVVAADPVTGVAPLNVTYSAFLSGGSAPFVVNWSLPNGNATSTATGLTATQTYLAAGWYPATAFVYNTTSSYGVVLVGYGSVWVYVAASHAPVGGGSKGTVSSTPPAQEYAGSGGSSTTSYEQLGGAIALGGLVGGSVAFVAGRSAGARGRAGGSDRRRTNEPPPTRE